MLLILGESEALLGFGGGVLLKIAAFVLKCAPPQKIAGSDAALISRGAPPPPISAEKPNFFFKLPNFFSKMCFPRKIAAIFGTALVLNFFLKKCASPQNNGYFWTGFCAPEIAAILWGSPFFFFNTKPLIFTEKPNFFFKLPNFFSKMC